MNKDSMIKHYKFLKYFRELGVVLFNSNHPDVLSRMQWTLFEDETVMCKLNLLKSSNILRLDIHYKHKSRVMKSVFLFEEISKWMTSLNTIVCSPNNYLFRITNGINNISYNEPNKSTTTVLEMLSPEITDQLRNNEIFDELEFQYSTMYNIEPGAFELFCIFNLLTHDVIKTEIEKQYRMVMKLDLSEYIDELVQNLTILKNKVIWDLSNDEQEF